MIELLAASLATLAMLSPFEYMAVTIRTVEIVLFLRKVFLHMFTPSLLFDRLVSRISLSCQISIVYHPETCNPVKYCLNYDNNDTFLIIHSMIELTQKQKLHFKHIKGINYPGCDLIDSEWLHKPSSACPPVELIILDLAYRPLRLARNLLFRGLLFFISRTLLIFYRSVWSVSFLE